MQIYGSPLNEQAVSLVRYSQIVGYTEWAFFGISHPDNIRYGISEIWTENMRQDITGYLAQAQRMIEDVTEFNLAPSWTKEEIHEYPSSGILLTTRAKLLEFGVRTQQSLSSGAVVDFIPTVPTVSIPIPFDIQDLDEVHVFYPGTDEEILFSSISKSSAPSSFLPNIYILTIKIPYARLVEYDARNNPEAGLVWSDSGIYQTTVDVRRIYTDPSDHGVSQYPHTTPSSFSSYLADPILVRIEDPEIGRIVFTESGSTRKCNKGYTRVLLNYRSGLTFLDRQAEGMIVRLAHSLMPSQPCKESMIANLWARDSSVPKIITRERVECPFGMSDGAWVAWKWATGRQVMRLNTLVGGI